MTGAWQFGRAIGQLCTVCCLATPYTSIIVRIPVGSVHEHSSYSLQNGTTVGKAVRGPSLILIT